MGQVKSSSSPRKIRPALTPEAEENQCISLAMDQAKRQLADGTAPSQIVTHFLKLGTTKAQLEREKLAHETKLLEARTEALQSAKRVEELYEEALKAMRRYSGQGDEEDYYDY